MCGRYVQVSKAETIEKKFNVQVPNYVELKSSYNVGLGKMAPIITQENPNEVQLFQFGYSPMWAKKQMYLLNARSEGDANKENDPNYKGGMGIIHKPVFQDAIRFRRCLVIADCFYEGPKIEKLSKPYLVYIRNRRPFAFAGIYSHWQNPNTMAVIQTFAIITTQSNPLMQKIGHHRSPVILEPYQEQKWLQNDAHLSAIIPFLTPYPHDKMNAYLVSPNIKSTKNDSVELVQPHGERLFPEFETYYKKSMRVEGFGNRKRDEKL